MPPWADEPAVQAAGSISAAGVTLGAKDPGGGCEGHPHPTPSFLGCPRAWERGCFPTSAPTEKGRPVCWVCHGHSESRKLSLNSMQLLSARTCSAPGSVTRSSQRPKDGITIIIVTSALARDPRCSESLDVLLQEETTAGGVRVAPSLIVPTANGACHFLWDILSSTCSACTLG